MKMGTAELAQGNGWKIEGNRMTEGEMGVTEEKSQERKW